MYNKYNANLIQRKKKQNCEKYNILIYHIA